MNLPEILDTPCPKGLDDLGGRWDESVLAEVQRFGRLSAETQAQVRGELGRLRSWVLLGFAESMATLAVRRASPAVLVAGLVALSLYDQEAIDRRDAQVVSILCVRAGALLGLNRAELLALVEPHTDAIGRAWLASYAAWEPVQTPSTHRETGTGASFAFEPIPTVTDFESLAKWADPRLR